MNAQPVLRPHWIRALWLVLFALALLAVIVTAMLVDSPASFVSQPLLPIPVTR